MTNNTATTQQVTVKEFIETHLIEHIGEIKDSYPYFAFLLMAVGIEFLGKCQRNISDWNHYDAQNPSADFNAGMKIPPLNKYSASDLRNNLRNGMAHSFLTKGQLCVSNRGTDGCSIGCSQLYADFKEACENVLRGSITMPTKSLNDVFFVVTNTLDGNSITGGTRCYNVLAPSVPINGI